MQNTRKRFASVFTAFAFLVAPGCASTGGLKVIDTNDAKNPEFAKAKQVFSASESPLVRVHGYGGRKVTVQIKEASRGVVGTITRDVPKATAENAGRDIGFRSEGSQVVPVERETVRWTTADLLIPIKPLPVGQYEIVLTADDGRTETQTFEVKGDIH
jgi:hypothetical protein